MTTFQLTEATDDLVIETNTKIDLGDGPNAFSLPAMVTCPGATDACLACCYTRGIPQEARWAYIENLQRLHGLLATDLFPSARRLGGWIAEHCPRGFRWHVSGDVFSRSYAAWIVAVCNASPLVQHWIYTRSLWAVRTLFAAPNLAVNVSCDHYNYAEAMACCPLGVRLTYLARGIPLPDLPDGSVIFPDYPFRPVKGGGIPLTWTVRQRGMLCPADAFGQHNHVCKECRRCLTRPI